MPFEKNNKIGKGRPQGSENILQSKIKQDVQAVVETLTSSIITDLAEIDSLPLREKLKALDSLLNYVLPKVKPMETEPEKGNNDMVITVEYV